VTMPRSRTQRENSTIKSTLTASTPSRPRQISLVRSAFRTRSGSLTFFTSISQASYPPQASRTNLTIRSAACPSGSRSVL
jgi:hypothetical protein